METIEFEEILIQDLADSKYVDKNVRLRGFVLTMRKGKKNSFIELKYGTAQVQVIVFTKLVEDVTIQSYVEIDGLVRLLPQGVYSSLPVEIHCSKLQIHSLADIKYMSECPPESGNEIKLEKRHLYLRDPYFVLITRIRSQLVQAIRKHFESSDCQEIIPPCFTGVEAESGASLFSLKHPGKSTDKPLTAYLTQSSQFSLEMALPGVGDCYCIAPSFRAENSHTRRHLTEFLHAEAEWGGIMKFSQHLDKLRDLVQGILKHFIQLAGNTLQQLDKFEQSQKRTSNKYQRALDLYEQSKDILILEHKDAVAECTKRGIFSDHEGTPFGERDDIPEAQERALIDAIGKIVFLVKFPKEFKSFYMALDPEDQSRVLGCDVEVPGVGEIIGSGVREADYNRLHERLLDSGLKPEDYSEYLDLRKYGFGFTSGMGLGVDRMLVWLLGLHSIREVTTFPRFPGYLRP